MRRRAASETPVAAIDAPAPAAADPAPVDADAASQPELIENVAAAVIETVIAATIQPTLSEVETPAEEPVDSLDVTVVAEPRSDEVAVILQSADSDVATTPVSLPTSPITLPVTRRSRRRPQAEVILDSSEPSAPIEAPAAPVRPALEAPGAAFGLGERPPTPPPTSSSQPRACSRSPARPPSRPPSPPRPSPSSTVCPRPLARVATSAASRPRRSRSASWASSDC